MDSPILQKGIVNKSEILLDYFKQDLSNLPLLDGIGFIVLADNIIY